MTDPRRRADRARPKAGRPITCCSPRSSAARSTASPTTRAAPGTTSRRQGRRTGRSRGATPTAATRSSTIDVRDRRAARAARRASRDELIAKAERDCFVGASLTVEAELRRGSCRDGDATTIEAVRARFSRARNVPLAFFDGPGGTQVPDSVIEAIAGYLRAANANLGGPFVTSRRHRRRSSSAARAAAAELPRRDADEVRLRREHDDAQLRALAHRGARLAGGRRDRRARSSTTTATSSPWLELAHDRGLTVHFADVDDECRLDLDHLRSLLSERTRVVAFPWASNAVGTVTPVAEIAELAHEAGALAWVDAVHYAPHGPIDVQAAGADVLLCSPYKFYGPHLGLAFGRRELLESWRPYKVRPGARAARRPPLRDRHARARAARGLRRRGRVPARRRLGVHPRARARARRSASSTGCRTAGRCTAPPTMDGRVPTFAITHDRRRRRRTRATRLGERGFAVWHGNYYAVEVMKRLGLHGRRVRVGIVHYNTEDEVDRLLAALGESPARAACRTRLLGHAAREEARRQAGRRGARLLHDAPRGARARFAALKATLAPPDGLWIAWPKKASKLETDLDFDAVQRGRARRRARRQQDRCAIDDDWQALRFVYRLADR